MIASSARPAADRQGSSPPPRERILAAARELFYRRGIHAVGVDAIAEAASTNKMTLYRHFTSKDVLVAACLSELTQEFDAAWDALAVSHAGDPEGQLLAWLRHVSDFKENAPTLRSSCRTRIIRRGVSSASIKPRSASGLFACVAMPSSPIPSVSPTKSFCYARAPALPPKVSDPKDFPRGSPECSRRWLPIMPDAASSVNCTAEPCAAVGTPRRRWCGGRNRPPPRSGR